MFKSIKSRISVFVIIMILGTWLITTLIVSYKCTGYFNMTFDTLIVLTIGVLLLVGLIVSAIISDGIKVPLKKMEKIMDGVTARKIYKFRAKTYKK